MGESHIEFYTKGNELWVRGWAYTGELEGDDSIGEVVATNDDGTVTVEVS